MSHPSVHLNPSLVNESSAKATTGRLYYWAGSGTDTAAAPPGVYRYVQIKDLAVADGHVLCADAEAGDSMTKATKDRSADLTSVACVGVAVGTVTADYYTYILVQGRHENILTDAGVSLGDPLMPHATTDGAADTAVIIASGSDVPIIFGYALENDSSAGRVSADINCI